MTGAEGLQRRDPQLVFVEHATDSDYFGCESILRSLPEWFGIEAAIDDYIAAIQTMQTLVVRGSDGPVGFLTLANHNHSTSEIHVMAVRRQFQRSGIGTALVDAAVQSAHASGQKLLEVKTLGPSDPDENYAVTRSFYESMGFLPLEELHHLWPGNPCLIMVKVVDEH